MMNGVLRRIAGVGALVAIAIASSPRMQAEPAARAAVSAPAANAAAAPAVVRTPDETGGSWGSMLACAACLVGAGVIVAGGPIAIVAATNTPGSAVALLACASSCYDAVS